VRSVMGHAPRKGFLMFRELPCPLVGGVRGRMLESCRTASQLPPRTDVRRRLFETRMSKATTLASKARATRQYMETFRRLQKLNRAFDCEHGHFSCAAEPDGACTEELLRLIGKAGDDPDGRP
jgi:hypothetical protein